MIANFIESFVNATAFTFLHFLWQGLVVGGLFFIVVRRLRNRYAVASFALATLFVAAAATFAWQWTQPVAFPSPTFAQAPAETSATQPESVPAKVANFNAPNEATDIVAQSSVETPFRESLVGQEPANGDSTFLFAIAVDYWKWFIACLWSVGVSFCALRLANDWRAVQQLRGASQPLPLDSNWNDRFDALIQRMGIRRPIEFLTSRELTSPIAMGVFQPVVILPLTILSQLPVTQVEAIVLHELAHIRRHDYLVNILQRVMETVFFFHPVVWCISHCMRVERELCCDDIASQTCNATSDYVVALAALEEFRATENYDLAPAAKGVRQGSLLHRIGRLLGADANDHLGVDWRLPAILLAGCAMFFLTLTVFVAAGDNGVNAINWNDLQTTSYSQGDETLFCVHTEDEILAVIVVEEPTDVSSTGSSSGVDIANPKVAIAWANMHWDDKKLMFRMFKDDLERVFLNNQLFDLKSGRVFVWSVAQSKVITQANQLNQPLRAYEGKGSSELNKKIRQLRARIAKMFPVKEMTKDPPAEIAEESDAEEPPAAAPPPADHNVTVFGKVVDDETGKVIEQGVIVQGGMFDPKKPAQPTTFGYSRSGGGRKTGKFSTTVNFPKGRTARVLVDGYYPQPVVTVAPKAGIKRMEVTLRLKKLRTVSGRVLNHKKEPVVGANVFSVKSVSTTYSDGEAWSSFDRKDEHSTPQTTDAEGRFSGVAVGEMNSVVVSAKEFDAWPQIVPEGKDEVVIQLPEPAKVVIDYDIAGDDDTTQLFYQYLSPFHKKEPQWKNVAIERTIEIKKGRTVLAALPAGSYQLARQKLASMGPVGRYIFMEREYFTIKQGESHTINWRRMKGARVKAKVTWPKDVKVAGLMYSVVGEPKKDLGGLDSRNILDGAGIDIKTGEIHTSMLSPGEYVLDIAVQRPVSKERLSISSPILPSYHQEITLKIPMGSKEIDLKEIALEMK